MKIEGNKSIAIIGGGPMGLSAAYQLSKLGLKPDLYEADDRLGGMAACFDFANQRIERYYHFHCTRDHVFIRMLNELGLEKKLKWQYTKMGFFFNNRLYSWGSVSSVLNFPKVPFISRIRYLLFTLRCLTIKKWNHLDKITAKKWLKKWLGSLGYEIFWSKLFHYKFFNYSEEISAAWIWSRINRLGKSRRFLKETLGYLEGGSDEFIEKIQNSIKNFGGKIYLSSKVESITPNKKGGGLLTSGKKKVHYDLIISTIPLPLLTNIFKEGGVKKEITNVYKNCKSIACACVIFNIKKPLSNYFWININDNRFKIPGLIEMSNLRTLSGNIVYVPFYMPSTNKEYKKEDSEFISYAWNCLKKINKKLSDDDLIEASCNRYLYAQPICEINQLSKLPKLNPFKGVFAIDTNFYYPEDRGISESIDFGAKIALLALNSLHE